MRIENIKGREVLDSRGNPTVEAELWLDNGTKILASVPSGKSTGSHEALELRDKDSNRFFGMGVIKAISNINNVISHELNGKDPSDQSKIDNLLIEIDGTQNKEKLGANAILAVSIAVCRAGAYSNNLPLYKHISNLLGTNANIKMPIPLFNIINGGMHADNNLQIQEFLISYPLADTFRERLRASAEHFHRLKNYLLNKGYYTGIGDEGGYASNFSGDLEAIDAIRDTGNARISFDFAGTKPKDIDYVSLSNENDILSLEDPEGEDSWESWQKLTKDIGERTILIGDDLFATNKKRLEKGIKNNVANAILVKPNQIGTITETLEVIQTAQKNNYAVVVSHRSGETEDTFIADLSVGVGSNYIKAGAPSRGERVSKYNRLLRIEEELLDKNYSN